MIDREKYVLMGPAGLVQHCERLETALLTLEAHHVEQNRIKGRDEAKSFTLRTIRQALTGSTAK